MKQLLLVIGLLLTASCAPTTVIIRAIGTSYENTWYVAETSSRRVVYRCWDDGTCLRSSGLALPADFVYLPLELTDD